MQYLVALRTIHPDQYRKYFLRDEKALLPVGHFFPRQSPTIWIIGSQRFGHPGNGIPNTLNTVSLTKFGYSLLLKIGTHLPTKNGICIRKFSVAIIPYDSVFGAIPQIATHVFRQCALHRCWYLCD